MHRPFPYTYLLDRPTQMTVSTKTKPWRDYQERAAELFRQMGFDVVIEEILEGARGKHEIDVVCRTKLGGVETLWIVECKDWKTSVPKAQVMTLAMIAQDVGANHAFLLSESGFQAGAIAAVNRTNISLTNISELQAVAAESIAELSIRHTLTEVKALESGLHDLMFRQRFAYATASQSGRKHHPARRLP